MLDFARSVDTAEVMAQSGDNSRGRDRMVGGGTDLARIVREGSEAEARREVFSCLYCKLHQFHAFCSVCGRECVRGA